MLLAALVASCRLKLPVSLPVVHLLADALTRAWRHILRPFTLPPLEVSPFSSLTPFHRLPTKIASLQGA